MRQSVSKCAQYYDFTQILSQLCILLFNLCNRLYELFLNFYKKLLFWLLFHHPEEQSLRKSIDMCIFVAIDAALT